MSANTMVRVGILGLIFWIFTTAYIWWQYHITQDEFFRPIVLMSLIGSAAWTLGLIIWRTVRDQESNP